MVTQKQNWSVLVTTRTPPGPVHPGLPPCCESTPTATEGALNQHTKASRERFASGRRTLEDVDGQSRRGVVLRRRRVGRHAVADGWAECV